MEWERKADAKDCWQEGKERRQSLEMVDVERNFIGSRAAGRGHGHDQGDEVGSRPRW